MVTLVEAYPEALAVKDIDVGQARDHHRLLPAVLLSEALRREVRGGSAPNTAGGRVE